jgi:hypothetical protein
MKIKDIMVDECADTLIVIIVKESPVDTDPMCRHLWEGLISEIPEIYHEKNIIGYGESVTTGKKFVEFYDPELYSFITNPPKPSDK